LPSVMNKSATTDTRPTIDAPDAPDIAQVLDGALPKMRKRTVTQEPRNTPHFSIRTARVDCTPRIAELSLQLGYPVSPDVVQARLETVLRDEDHLLVVAESQDAQIIGWLHATVSRSLVDEPACQIAGLVVDEMSRRKGVGRALMQHAEAWAAHRGLKSVSLRSNIVRDGVHTFYERLAYERVKAQHAYRKRLAPRRT
jgi:GNAT superfamily N-acetyltransferase